MAFLLPPSYGVVLLVVLAQCVQGVLETIPVGAARKRVFTKAFWEKHWPGLDPAPNSQGYPDTGYGRYADKLSHKDWLDLANAQRVHGNLLEQITAVVCVNVRARALHTTAPHCRGWLVRALTTPRPLLLRLSAVLSRCS